MVQSTTRGAFHARRLAATLGACLTMLSTAPQWTAAQGQLREEKGTLPDGTRYIMRVPANWNGTLIRDLDYASRPDNPLGQYLIGRGFAMAGTARHTLRPFQYDPAREIANLNIVLDQFQARFRKPTRVIQYGCSGGGHVSLAVAEDFSDRVDGAVVLAAHTPVWLMNTFLDGWFTLKTLIAPTLPIVNLPYLATRGNVGHGVEGEIPESWRRAINGAQETPQGRARIALAAALGQWPAWSTQLVPLPRLDDVNALQHSLYHNVYDRYSENPGGEARIMFESAANGQQLSWNEGIDYRQLFETANQHYQNAVLQLYRDAGLDVMLDLAKLNAAPRVTASPHALTFWGAPGRTVKGNPKVPVLRMHEIGDFQVPLSLVQGYEPLVRQNGKDALYRTAFVEAPTHCGFNVAESAAAIETMMRRLNTGQWGSTEPEQMNTLAASLGTNVEPRFINPEPYLVKTYNRVWVPTAQDTSKR